MYDSGDHMGHSLPASSVSGFLQARTREWVAISFSRGSDLPDPGIQLGSPTLQAVSLPSEPPGKPVLMFSLSIHEHNDVFPLSSSLVSFNSVV